MKSDVSPRKTPIWASICIPVAPSLKIYSGHSPRMGVHKQSFGGGTAPACPPWRRVCCQLETYLIFRKFDPQKTDMLDVTNPIPLFFASFWYKTKHRSHKSSCPLKDREPISYFKDHTEFRSKFDLDASKIFFSDPPPSKVQVKQRLTRFAKRSNAGTKKWLF